MSVELMGINIDGDTFMKSIDRAFDLINDNKVSQVVTINPEMFAQAEVNPEFKQILNDAEMIIPDGIGVKIALRLQGKKAERIPGIDFARTILDWCAKNDKPVAIIGSKEEVITKAVQNLKNEIEGLNIIYYHNGYFDNDEEIYNSLKEKAPKLVLVALGSPKQEFFIYRAKQIISPCLMIGVGGSLDVWSGEVKRAPKIYQKLGLEWLYRTVTQPERFKRIFPAIPMFLWKVITYKEDE
jgi:N-acetylglucosaminyldiphosphoundecaprenol N-acetyl-beta-D-mannosaminyltransferase